MSKNVILNFGWIRGPSKSHDQYPRRMDSFFKNCYMEWNFQLKLEIAALNVPAFISHRQKLNLKRHSYTEVLENYIFQ